MTKTTILSENENEVKLSVRCFMCGEETVLTVPKKGFEAWQNGALIQDALPKMSVVEREALISGMCADCQKSFYGIK